MVSSFSVAARNLSRRTLRPWFYGVAAVERIHHPQAAHRSWLTFPRLAARRQCDITKTIVSHGFECDEALAFHPGRVRSDAKADLSGSRRHRYSCFRYRDRARI